MRHTLCAILVLTMVCPLWCPSASSGPMEGAGERSAEAISIIGDASLLEAAVDNGWDGNGSIMAPVMIRSLTFEGPNGPAIRIEGTSLHLDIVACRITDVEGPAIELSDCSNVTLMMNWIVNATVGVLLDGVKGGEFIDDWLEDCMTGISGSNVTACAFVNETITGTRGIGISLADSGDCTVEGSVVASSEGYGIDLDGCISNRISLNSFQFNRNSTKVHNVSRTQAFDGTGFNAYVTTDGRGNHWTDRETPDMDMNGIADEPYLIDGSSARDNFPLTSSPAFITTAPGGLSADPRNGKVVLTWDVPDRTRRGIPIMGYSVYRSDEGSLFALVGTVDVTTFTDIGLDNGKAYSYRVAAITEFGEGTRSPAASVIPDGTGPAFSIVGPTEDGYVNDTIVLVELDVKDIGDILAMEMSVDGGIPVNVSANRSFVVAVPGDGAHSVAIKAFDRAMNPTADSVTFTVDTRPPVLNLSEVPEYVRDSTLQFGLVALDANGVLRSWFEIDGSEGGDFIDGSASISGLTEGPHDLVAFSMDPAYNRADRAVGFIVDITPPSISIISPLPGSVYGSGSVPFSASSSDHISGIGRTEYRLDNGPWAVAFDTTLQVSGGQHLLEARAFDRAGWSSLSNVSFTVDPMIDLPLNGTIKGRVVNEDGYPIEGARIGLDGTNVTETASDGIFEIGVAPGVHRVTVHVDGDFVWEQNVDVLENMTVDEGDITVQGGEDGPRSPSSLLIVASIVLTVTVLSLLAASYFLAGRRRDIEDVWGEE